MLQRTFSIGTLVLLSALAAWVLFFGTPLENTITVAAAHRIDFGTVLFYKFRDAALLGASGNPPLHFLFMTIHFLGSRFVWALALLFLGSLAYRLSWRAQLAAILIALTVPLYGESALVWLGVFISCAFLFVSLRKLKETPKSLRRILGTSSASVGVYFFTLLAFSLASPLEYLHLQKTLGGKVILDHLQPYSAQKKIPLNENCFAVVNPPDLFGMHTLERIETNSLKALSALTLLDLKVVEENYALLTLKGADGKDIFSDAARRFARAETELAKKTLPRLLEEKKLCLVANFETLPELEQAPFSRARKIIDRRRALNLDTHTVQVGN